MRSRFRGGHFEKVLLSNIDKVAKITNKTIKTNYNFHIFIIMCSPIFYLTLFNNRPYVRSTRTISISLLKIDFKEQCIDWSIHPSYYNWLLAKRCMNNIAMFVNIKVRLMVVVDTCGRRIANHAF